MSESSHSVPPDPDADDDALAERVAELTDRLRRGETFDLAADDPYANELRLLLPTLRMLGELAGPSARDAGLGSLGDFRILREAGRGGMGVVYEAVQDSLDRRVALKVLLNAAALDPRQVQRFQVEARAAASLHHPHIVPVFAIGSEDGIPFYAMQFISGRNLARVIEAWEAEPASGSRLVHARFRKVAELGLQVADALEYAHHHGVLHRDIKPSNLLLDEAGRLWVTDFGLARIQSALNLTQTGDQLGTPRYMSPEQALGRVSAVDERADVYSLGATIYELLTLHPPFNGDDRLVLLRQIAEDEPVPPRTIVPEIPFDLETIVLKAIAKEPADRFANAADLANDLRRFLDDRPILARRPTLPDRAGKWLRRHRPLVIAASVVVFLAVAGLSVGTWRYTTWLQRHNASLQAEVVRADRQTSRARQAERRTASALDVAEQQRRLAVRHLYGARLRHAQQTIAMGQVDQAQEILTEIRGESDDDPRGFAWHYLWRLSRREIALLASHPSGALALCLSPDGRILATGDGDGTIHTSDLASERVLARWPGHSGAVRRLAYSSDGSLLASAAVSDADRCEVWVREVRTGRRIAVLAPIQSQNLLGLAFTPSGRRLVVAWRDKRAESIRVRQSDLQSPTSQISPFQERDFKPEHGLALNAAHFAAVQLDGPLTVFDTETFLPQWSASGQDAHQGWPTFSADGNVMAAEDGHQAVVREVATGRERSRVPITWPQRIVDFMVLSADGARLLVAYSDPAGVRLFDVAGDRPAPPRDLSALLPAHHRADHFVFSPDGSTVAVIMKHLGGGAGPLAIWECSTGRLLRTYPGLKQFDYQALFTNNGRSLTLSGGGSVQRWCFGRSEIEAPDTLTGHVDEAWAVTFSPDGRMLATGSDDTETDNTIKLWDAATGRPLRGWRADQGTIAALAYSPDGATLAAGSLSPSRNVRLWDVATGRLRATFEGHTDRVRAVVYSPDGTRLASAGNDRTIRLWEPSTRHPVATLTGHSDTVRSIAFRRDGRLLASASNDRTVRLWDVATGKATRTIAGREKYSALAFSPDGSLLAAADQGGILTLWDARSGERRASIHANDPDLLSVQFSPDGRSLAAAGAGRVIRIWGVLTGQELLTLEGHAAQVNDLAFSPDGSILASVSHDGAVRIWRAREP